MLDDEYARHFKEYHEHIFIPSGSIGQDDKWINIGLQNFVAIE
jgi:hypothetical protein